MRMHNPPHPGEILSGLWLNPMGHSRQAKGRLHHKLFVPTVIVNDETRISTE
jgi:plasmid maintenance system antidote protein VapI